MRQKLAIGLIGLAAVAFVVAVVEVAVTGTLMGVVAEGISRASTNLALLAIALLLWCKASPSDQGRLSKSS